MWDNEGEERACVKLMHLAREWPEYIQMVKIHKLFQT